MTVEGREEQTLFMQQRMPPCVSVSRLVCVEWQVHTAQADDEEEENEKEEEEEEEAKTRREEADEEEVVCERVAQSSRVRLKEDVSIDLTANANILVHKLNKAGLNAPSPGDDLCLMSASR